MRTVSFLSVLNYVASLAFGTSDDLQLQHAASICKYINKEVRTAWEEYPWPEMETVEQRYYRPVWSANPGTYNIGDEVYEATTDAYWIATAAVSSDDVPGVSTLWAADICLDRYVGYTQPGKTVFGEVLGVWTQNPRVCRALLLPFWLSDNGVQLGALGECQAPTSVWLEFRRQVSQFTVTPWAAGSFTTGANVLFTDGDCYVAAASTSATPGTDATWTKTPMPYVLALYVQQAAYSEWLKDDGQQDKSTAARTEAELLLARAMQQYSSTQGQNASYSVRT